VHAAVPLGDKWGLHWSARRSITDFLKTPTYKQFFERALQVSEITDGDNNSVTEGVSREEDFFFHDFAGKLLFNPNDKYSFGCICIKFKNHLDHVADQMEGYRRSISQLKHDCLSMSGQLHSRWDSCFSSHLDVYYSPY